MYRYEIKKKDTGKIIAVTYDNEKCLQLIKLYEKYDIDISVTREPLGTYLYDFKGNLIDIELQEI